MATAILPTPTTSPPVLPGRRLDGIPVPPEVTAFLGSGPTILPEDRREWERQLTLSFLYGGMEVACHETPDGDLEIFHAADVDEMVPWLGALSDAQRRQITYLHTPRLWAAVLWDAGVRPPRRKLFWFF